MKIEALSMSVVIGLLSVVDASPQTTTPSSVGKVTDVWVVIKSHFDLGYTDQAGNVFDRYRKEMMDKSLLVVDQNRALPKEKQFVWTVPGWPLKAQMLGPEQDPARKERIEKAVSEGSIVSHALPFTMHTESQDLEDLVRGLGFASKVCREYGRPLPVAAKMTDVPSHSWVIPTLLYHAGVKFLHIGVNPASQYPRVPQLFWWEGADGSQILCGYTIDYGSSLLPPEDWPCKNYLSMIMAGDNQGPPTPQDVEKWRKQYEEQMPGVKVHFGTLDDFANAVFAEKADLPVVRGDMPDTWIHGLMSMPQATKTARDIRPLEPALETLDTQLRFWGLAPNDVSKPLAEAYEQSLLYSEHTWGMNAEFGPRRLYGQEWQQWMKEMEQEPVPAGNDYTKVARGSKRKWLQSYEDHRNYANKSAKIVTAELNERLTLLASSVKVNKKSILVYNALPWKRSGIAEVDGRRVFAKDVPANGYKVIPFGEEKRVNQNNTQIETRYFRALFDLNKGGIRSLIDKKSGIELADLSSPYVIGQFLHERFSTNEVNDRFFRKYSRIQGGWGLDDFGKPGMPDASQMPYRAITPTGWKMTVAESDIETCVTLTASDTKGLAQGYSLTFTFPKVMPYVDVAWNVTAKTPEKYPEGGWLCFPFNIQKPSFTIGRPGAPINPDTDIVPGTNRHLFAVTTGVSISGEQSGVALCSPDAPLLSLGEPGLWRWSMDYVPEIPSVFVNLYNNMWNTNFPLWQEGSWSERVRIWPVAKDEAIVENLTVGSWQTRMPLLAEIAGNTNGTLPATQSGLSVSNEGVLVTAFGQNPDGEGTLLRLWDQTGISGIITVDLPRGHGFKTAIPVNLRGETAGSPVPVQGNRLRVKLNRYAPASFILR